jgi:(E)-4-hydroxy-3-methylbut-2-enyl-diphosphate synthase
VIKRRMTKPLSIGNVTIGGGAPIVVQSMCSTDTRDVAATVYQIHELEEVGCEVVRVAAPDMQAARALPEIKRQIHIPLIVDIHFDYEIALAAIEGGVDALRLNPGNIRRREQVEAVVRKCKERQIPIRIGVNAGSLPPEDPEAAEREDKAHLSPEDWIAHRMVDAALGHIKILEDLDFDMIKISLKAFDVPTTVAAYRRMATLVNYPFHLGITESGLTESGSIRSAVGIGILLNEGLGDTIRVSLTDHPREEVRVGFEILKSLNLRVKSPTLISCPTCGRIQVDLFPIANQVNDYLRTVGKPITVAVMGCVVNGPGEARQADVGIAGGKGKAVLFRKGQIVRTVKEEEIVSALMHEIDEIEKEMA